MDGVEGLSVDAASGAGAAPGARSSDGPSPYTRADLYDLLFRDYVADLDFYLGIARAAGGPVLDLGCGTGRVLLRALEAGLDVDGLDDSAEMLARLRQNAAARGLTARVTQGDMRAFALPRRYACVMVPFNAFAHNLDADQQLATLRCCREHLLPGGRLVFDVFSATPAMVATPVAEPVLELETPHPETGLLLRLYDGRRLEIATQTQHSEITIEELDAQRRVARAHRFVAVVRWIDPGEMELLLRRAGYARWEITGGFDGPPAAGHEGGIVVSAWTRA